MPSSAGPTAPRVARSLVPGVRGGGRWGEHFGIILAPSWHHFGIILVPYGRYVVPCWHHLGTILVLCYAILAAFWHHVGITFSVMLCHFGIMLAPFWHHSVAMLCKFSIFWARCGVIFWQQYTLQYIIATALQGLPRSAWDSAWVRALVPPSAV